MNSILITHSYFMRLDPKQWRIRQAWMPLGTLYSAALLRKNGMEVRFHDVTFAESPGEIASAIGKYNPGIVIICDDGFNYLTKMCLTNMRRAAFEMTGIATRAGCTVVVSSSDATDHPADYLDAGASFVVEGEPEQTLLRLCTFLLTGNGSAENIPGLIYPRDGSLRKNQAVKPVDDPGQLPCPARDLADMEAYRSVWIKKYGYFAVNMVTSRGCPYRCHWCAKPIYGYRYGVRSPEDVANELIQLKKDCNFDKVWFCDDIFGLKPEWIARFAELIKENHLKFTYWAQSRADILLQPGYIENLAESGCETIWLGAESGSQRILDAMNKNQKVSEIYLAAELLKKAGIRPALFIQYGYPGEDISDIRLTLKMLKQIMPADIGISVSYPLPGTVFYEQVKSGLREKQNWTDSDDLALMFSNTYPPGFYKALHRYTHKSFRMKQGFQAIGLFFRRPGRNPFMAMLKLMYYIPAALLAKIRMNAAIR